MGTKQLKCLKKEIEEYRRRLEEELKSDGGLVSTEKIVKLSRELDELIVRYERTLVSNDDNV